MRYYVYKPNGALVTYIGLSYELRMDAEFNLWPDRVPQHPQGEKYAFEIDNPNSRVPDILRIGDKLGYYFSEKMAHVFRDFCGEENDYFEVVARGTSKKGAVDVPYTGIHSKVELDCLDEENSYFIAVEYNNPKFKAWVYEDLECPKFISEKIGNHHHFRLKGWRENSFISEPLAKALKAVKPNNLGVFSIDEYFRIYPHTLKENLFAPRNLNQSMLYGYVGWEEFARTHNHRRRNIDAAYFLQHALPSRLKST